MIEFILAMTVVFTPTNSALGTDFTTTIHEQMHRQHASLEACNSIAGLRALQHYNQYQPLSRDGVHISHTCVPVEEDSEL